MEGDSKQVKRTLLAEETLPAGESLVAEETLRTMLIGTVFSGILFCAIGTVLYAGNRLPYALGTLLGVVFACGIALHLYISIDRALDLEPEKAANYTKRMALLRMGLMGIPVVLAVLLPQYLSVLGTMIGLLSLKVGALLQPVVLKLISKFHKKEGERKC